MGMYDAVIEKIDKRLEELGSTGKLKELSQVTSTGKIIEKKIVFEPTRKQEQRR